MKGASFKFKDECDKKLLGALQRMPREEMGPIAVAMLEPGAQRVATTAKSLAPRDTSAMANSIRVSKVKERFAKNKSVWRQTVRVGTRKELNIPQDALGFYPAAIEFGYKESNIRHAYQVGGAFYQSRGQNMPHEARPFMRPAMHNNISEIENEARMVAARMIPETFTRAVSSGRFKA